MTLKDWINSKTVTVVAQKLKTNTSAVRHWRIGRSLPKSSHMRKIKLLSRGRVTYDEMIDTFYKNQKKKS